MHEPPDALDFEYITMVTTCLEPIASAITRLEGDKKTFYGELLPTLLTIMNKLKKMLNSPGFTQFNKLLAGLIFLIENRLKNILEIKNKKGGIAGWHIFQMDNNRKYSILSKKAREMMDNVSDKAPVASLERQLSDFYDFGSAVLNESESSVSEFTTDVDLEILEYLNDLQTGLEMLNFHPLIKKYFLTTIHHCQAQQQYSVCFLMIR